MSRPSRFEGRIGRTVAESEPYFDEGPHPDDAFGGRDSAANDSAPNDSAPNVVVVLLDDTGYAQFGCYGSDIDTPNIDALAAGGLQFTNFHATPLCSPTRASLLTGRSAHAVGMRAISNFRTGFPNMLGHISNDAATMAEVLSDDGYATFCVGKWHLARMEQCSAAGPFDQWPLGRGFDRFYGFLEGETDQFHPDLVCDNHHVEAPSPLRSDRSGHGGQDTLPTGSDHVGRSGHGGQDGSPVGGDGGDHLPEGLGDQGLGVIARSGGLRPDRADPPRGPPRRAHAPHQAPEAYLEKYRGRYDEGWDVVRRRWFERQLALGVIPEGTELAPRNPGVEPWEDLPENQRRLAARLQEAFAAFLDHTDDQIGRLVEGLDRLGQLDNTVLCVLADNGASQEGGPYGVMHEMKFFNGILETPDEAIERINDIGGPHSHTNYPWGWAQCGNSPFKWYKQNTHEGGVHVPMVISWPDGLDPAQRGTRRDQFVNVADIAPTLYELVGVEAPGTYRGIEQLPVTGHSFASVLQAADAPATNTLQYFEMGGSRALVAGEWKAVCKHTPGADYDAEAWELYHLAEDRSECDDLAEAQPDKLAELVALWWVEADRHGVLPLDDRTFELFGARFRDRSPHPVDRRYRYRPPMSPMPAQASAPIGGRSFTLTARVTRSADDGGVLFSTGTENSGIALFVQDGRLVLDYNAFDDHTVIESDVEVPARDAELVLRCTRGDGMSGSAELLIDGVPAGSAKLPLYLRVISSVGSSIGYGGGSAVSPRYQGAFPFSGTLHEVEIQLHGHAPGADRATARAEMARQ
nr:arylsulfatase [uncultured Candidatus Microthrix sp.]